MGQLPMNIKVKNKQSFDWLLAAGLDAYGAAAAVLWTKLLGKKCVQQKKGLSDKSRALTFIFTTAPTFDASAKFFTTFSK
jgi:hypothetical protein